MLYEALLPWKMMQQAIRTGEAATIHSMWHYSFAWFASSSKMHYKELAALSTGHYHSLSVSDGAPNLIKQPTKKCTTYNEMLEKFERLRQRFSET